MKYRIELAEARDAQAWDGYVRGHERATFYHLFAWRELIRTVFGQRPYYLVTRDTENRVRGVYPLVRLRSILFGDYMVSLPYVNYGGPLGDTAAIEQAMAEEAARIAGEAGCSHVESRDVVQRSTWGWEPRTDKVVMELALPRDKEALSKAIGSKLRAQVKRPVREGATVAHGGLELVGEFYQVFAHNMRDLGTPVYSRRLFETVLETFPENARIVVVRLGGRPVAAGFLIDHRGRTEIPWASALREHNRAGVNMMLYWEALTSAIERGSTLFDFGRSSRDSGTYRFKKQWGAVEHPLLWYYWMREGSRPPNLTPSNRKYRLAIDAWRRLPVSVTRLLGPYLVRSLP